MKLTNEVITIFNKVLNEDGYDLWLPTSIRGCSWYSEVASTVTADGLIAADKYTIRIPEDAVVKDDKSYVEPVEFVDGDHTSTWTLRQGDVIVKGVETSASLTPAELQRKYGTVVTILGVTDNRRAPNAKHWRVVGK